MQYKVVITLAAALILLLGIVFTYNQLRCLVYLIYVCLFDTDIGLCVHFDSRVAFYFYDTLLNFA